MRLTGMSRLATGMQAGGYPELGADLEEMLEHLKWNLWHGKVDRALGITDELIYALDLQAAQNARRVIRGQVRRALDHHVDQQDGSCRAIPAGHPQREGNPEGVDKRVEQGMGFSH